ncbi:hypothetical protein QA649_11950 [Bradyrhizobium sp. CB1717]|uniref:hypothetical protein n=1 Tax=Bradyrhizobium sp. CB1717 TaxID=3039154 RepID=UPI0024B1F199|nr:hypothetical protein [Bradyrhizobium sp. CB1717]WFU26878.1 hypothetical protein QA649_11950 [Bradyrhizobium sp. CB1717]
MRLISFLCVVTCLALSGAALARGGVGSSMSMASGGALGTSAGRPGTNSLGTALSSSESGGHAMGGPLLGTDRAIDKEDARLAKMLKGSICRGC